MLKTQVKMYFNEGSLLFCLVILISQKGNSFETQFRQEATCLEYLRQATGKDRQIQFCIFLHSLSEKV